MSWGRGSLTPFAQAKSCRWQWSAAWAKGSSSPTRKRENRGSEGVFNLKEEEEDDDDDHVMVLLFFLSGRFFPLPWSHLWPICCHHLNTRVPFWPSTFFKKYIFCFFDKSRRILLVMFSQTDPYIVLGGVVFVYLTHHYIFMVLFFFFFEKKKRECTKCCCSSFLFSWRRSKKKLNVKHFVK